MPYDTVLSVARERKLARKSYFFCCVQGSQSRALESNSCRATLVRDSRIPVSIGSRPTGCQTAQEWIPLLGSSNQIAGLKIEETIRKLNLRPDEGRASGVQALRFSIDLRSKP